MIGRTKIKNKTPELLTFSISYYALGDNQYQPLFYGNNVAIMLGVHALRGNVLTLSRTFDNPSEAYQYAKRVRHRWIQGLRYERLNPRKSEAPQ